VTVVEWGAGLVEQLAESYLEIQLERAPDSEVRGIELIGHGGDWVQRLSALSPQS
jgi:tRNA threonylcarbamoyladenosine biosynthesis protein TsaE